MPTKSGFEPLPDDVELVDSVLDLPIDDDGGEDGDDREVADTPGLLRRLASRAATLRG